MTSSLEKLLWGGAGIAVGFVGANWYENRSEEQTTAAEITVESTLVPVTTTATEVVTTLPTTTQPNVYTFPSGTVCQGPLLDITVIYVPEFETYSLFKSIQVYDAGEKFSAQPAPVAQADARYIATLSGFDATAIPNVDNWLINGQAPTAATPAKVPTDCVLNGVQILR